MKPDNLDLASPKGWTAAKAALYDAAVRDSSLAGADLRVLWCILSTFLNRETRDAWPGAQRLSAELGLHISTIWRSLRHLIERGYLIQTSKGGINLGGRNNTNHYTANFQRLLKPSETEIDESNSDTGNSRTHAIVSQEPEQETVAPTQQNSRTTATETVARMRHKPLEEPFKEPSPDRVASDASPNGSARDASYVIQGFEKLKRGIRTEFSSEQPSPTNSTGIPKKRI